MQPVTKIDASGEPPFTGSWNDFDLAPGLAEAIRTHKGPGRYLEQVSTIQRQIMKAPKDASVYGISSTGSGKAFAAFVPALDDMLKGRAKSALVLAVTNPLLDQHVLTVKPVLELLPKKVSVTKADPKAARRILDMAKSGPVLIFSTPHQILGMSKTSPDFAKFVSSLDYVILDEVDAIVADPTFGKQVSAVVAAAPRCRVIAVTATHTDAALDKIRAMSHQPVVHVVAGKVHTAVIEHAAVFADAKDLMVILATVLHNEMGTKPPTQRGGGANKIIVFGSTTSFVEFAYHYCVAAGVRNAVLLHSKLNDGPKRKAQAEFSRCRECVMFGSDVTARGMDFEGVTLVVQIGFTPPDTYMQRAGRTGRGLVKTGRCILLLTEKERIALDIIKRARGVEFKETRAVPEYPLRVNVSQKYADSYYRGVLGAYKPYLKTLKWTKEDLFAEMGAIVKGAGFKVPTMTEEQLRKRGLA